MTSLHRDERTYLWSYVVDGEVKVTREQMLRHVGHTSGPFTDADWLAAARNQLDEGLDLGLEDDDFERIK